MHFSKFVSSSNIGHTNTILFFRFYNINVFYSFSIIQCVRRHVTICGCAWLYVYLHIKASPRVVSCAYVIGGSCINCGVSRTTTGLCSRCLSLPCSKKCKRNLPVCCFNEGQRYICQVHLHVAITCILHTGIDTLQIGLLFHKSLLLSLHVLSSVSAYRTAKSGAPYDVPH